MKILFFRKHPIAIADDSVDSEGEKGAKGHKPKKGPSFQIEKELLDLLKKLNLEDLSSLFEENEVTVKDLQQLEDSHLKTLGIKKFIHRKLILDASKKKPHSVQKENIQEDVQQQLGEKKSSLPHLKIIFMIKHFQTPF